MLKRNLNLISNFGVAFSNISILTGISSLFQYGLMTGGPVIMLWSWPIVTLFTLMIGLCLAEICSSYPHSGGVYYWSFHLCKSSQHAAFWSWMTAWLNICATISMIAAVDFACSTTIGSILYLIWEITCTPFEIYVMFVLIVILQAILNSLKGKTLHILGKLSIFWHAIGTLIIIICILKGKDNHSFVLNDFVNLTGWNNSIYVALLGGLMAQFTMTGYDGSAHVSEETMDPHRSAPKGIIYSILISFVVGWAYMFALLFAISDYTAIVNDPFPISQIFLFTTGKIGAVLLLLIIVGAMIFCGLSIMTSASRLLFAFARDGGVPGSVWISKLNTSTWMPINATIIVCICICILTLPSLINNWAFNAIVSVSTIATYISYSIPILIKFIYTKNSFEKGPFHLGIYSNLLGCISLIWTLFITILFVLPTQYPITMMNFNYSSIVLIIVLLFSSLWWILDAKRWFKGPVEIDFHKSGESELVEI